MKKSLIGLSAVIAMLSLSACGNSGNDASNAANSSSNSSSNTSASSESNANTSSNTTTNNTTSTNASNGDAEPVTISFMHFKSDVTDGIQKIVDQFEAENPNIKVDVQPVKYDDYYTILKTKLAGGDVVDVFTLNAGSQAKLFVDGGYVEDLTGQEFLSSFDTDVLTSQATDGKNYIMPLNAGPIAVFYNKNIFKELNLEVPRTFDAMIEDAKKIKEAGKTPFALGWKDAWTLGMWIGRDLPSNTALVANQPDFFDKLETGGSKFADNPAVKTTLDHAQQIFDLGNKDQLGLGYNDIVDLFAKGDVGMMYMGTWPLADIQKKNPDLYNTGIGYFPYPFSNDETLNKLEFNPDASLAVGSKSQHKEAAMKFLAFMASKEGGDAWVKNTNTLSYVKGATTDIAPALNDLKPYFDNGQLYNSQAYMSKTTIDWTTQLIQSLQKMFFKKDTPDQVVTALDDWVSKNHK
ncbi:carbohydrate ABC transporter substrate-binding protein (CUT1 family) [Paenibacillus taihuensis]|uniref:Carbohydrate ABC transporter substrate-binding protein (CUT1 family) n=1 Tax=Paenibacillus taihuensis TaxID=1156355 RepID=A0A3D9S3Y0_9BACL|nr:extracellular solute-binding protein [Paenibacillus taihuensis]REE87444.1 carbohydrate ABC transporter substrate-binding protein (CUT1 family) [Paenibacillus taihuensis]